MSASLAPYHAAGYGRVSIGVSVAERDVAPNEFSSKKSFTLRIKSYASASEMDADGASGKLTRMIKTVFGPSVDAKLATGLTACPTAATCCSSIWLNAAI